MTVRLSNSWTSDLSFEISDLLIYVVFVTYIGDSGFPWLVVQAAARPAYRRRGCRARYTIRHTTYRCITELYLGLQLCDDVGLLGKGPNDETRDILMPNELKNAEHLSERLVLRTVLGSERRSGSDRRSEPNPNPIPNPNPNPSRSEPINFSFNSLLSFRSPI